MALINLRNALMGGKRLPYDAEVEYLQSSETQYIDVDASKVATASRYVCYGQYMVSSNQAMMWSHGYRGIRSYGSYIGFVTGKYATTNTTVIYDTGCIIDFDAVSLKGILTSPSGTELANVTIGSSSASGGLRIFAASETATGYLASQSRIYFMRVYDAAGNILFDFIPVRKGAVGYLYDRVSGKLFGNAGTGDFVLGPDVVPATWTDGEYWNTLGVATTLSGASRCDNFIPVQPSSSVTFYLGARPGGTTLYMVEYNANKERVNSTYNSNGVARTVTIPANCYFVRVSADTAKKNKAYIHDNTNDRYLLRDGMVPID